MSSASMKKTGVAEDASISDRIMLAPEVRRITGLSATTMWREGRAHRFPKPVAISPGRVGYIASEIEAWLKARIAARNARTAA